ncbi:MAG: MFS transporter, partial [Sulfolobales archaeon]
MDLRVRGILVLAIAGALSSFSSSIYNYQIRFYGVSVGFGYGSQSVYEVYSYTISIIFILFTGFLSDILGRRLFTFIAYFIGALSPISIVVLPPWMGFPISIILYNIYFSLVIVARNILVMDLAGHELGRWFGYIMMSSSIAMVIGPIAGYMFREILGYQALFIILFILLLSSSLVVLYIPSQGRGVRREVSISVRDLVLVARDLRSIWFIVIYGCLDRFSFYLWSPLAPTFLAEKGFEDGDVAILYTIQNISWFLTSYLFGLASERNPVAVLAISELLTALSALILSLDPRPQSLAPYISFIMLGASIASWIPSYNLIIHELVYGEHIGKIYSSLYVASTIAGIPSPYIGSVLRTVESE